MHTNTTNYAHFNHRTHTFSYQMVTLQTLTKILSVDTIQPDQGVQTNYKITTFLRAVYPPFRAWQSHVTRRQTVVRLSRSSARRRAQRHAWASYKAWRGYTFSRVKHAENRISTYENKSSRNSTVKCRILWAWCLFSRRKKWRGNRMHKSWQGLCHRRKVRVWYAWQFGVMMHRRLTMVRLLVARQIDRAVVSACFKAWAGLNTDAHSALKHAGNVVNTGMNESSDTDSRLQVCDLRSSVASPHTRAANSDKIDSLPSSKYCGPPSPGNRGSPWSNHEGTPFQRSSVVDGRSTATLPQVDGRSTATLPQVDGRSTATLPRVDGRSTATLPRVDGRSTGYSSMEGILFRDSGDSGDKEAVEKAWRWLDRHLIEQVCWLCAYACVFLCMCMYIHCQVMEQACWLCAYACVFLCMCMYTHCQVMEHVYMILQFIFIKIQDASLARHSRNLLAAVAREILQFTRVVF
jgi:hypothetical protein